MEKGRLKSAINRAGVTQTWIAEQLGVDNNTVWRWSSGRHDPDDKTKKELATLLNVSVAYLMGETDDLSVMHDAPGRRRSQALEDLEKMLGDLSHENPDIGLLLRSTVENWDDLNEHDIKFISDSIAIALGRVSDDLKERIRRESKDGRL